MVLGDAVTKLQMFVWILTMFQESYLDPCSTLEHQTWSNNQSQIANQRHVVVSVYQLVDFQKSPSSDSIWRGTKDFSYLIGANFTDPKTGRCAWTNQSSSQGPLGIKLSLTSTKRIET